MFRPSIPALSRLHLLPFEARYLSPRNPKHAQRPIPPLPSPIQNAKKGPSTTLFRPKAQHTFYTKISYCRALNMKHKITFHVTPADLHFLHPSGQWVRCPTTQVLPLHTSPLWLAIFSSDSHKTNKEKGILERFQKNLPLFLLYLIKVF